MRRQRNLFADYRYPFSVPKLKDINPTIHKLTSKVHISIILNDFN